MCRPSPASWVDIFKSFSFCCNFEALHIILVGTLWFFLLGYFVSISYIILKGRGITIRVFCIDTTKRSIYNHNNFYKSLRLLHRYIHFNHRFSEFELHLEQAILTYTNGRNFVIIFDSEFFQIRKQLVTVVHNISLWK